MSLFPTLRPATDAPDGLRFVLGEIDRTLPDGTEIRADLVETGQGWVWSARVNGPFDAARGMHAFAAFAGPLPAASEEEGSAAALDWIRARLA